jgi:medium-chain acyl-[acyl-carrier-protein] hydrolase
MAISSLSQVITSYLVDCRRRLSLPGLLALFQEMAWRQAEQAGHGYAVMIARRQGWVLARQQVEVNRWPDWNELVELRTWLRAPRGLLVFRDFEVACGKEILARGVGTWMAIDMLSRQPVAPFLGRAEFCTGLNFQPVRIEPFVAAAELGRVQVRASDLDLNGHVNNLRYAAWVLDAVQVESLRGYEVNFLAELGQGDEVGLEASGLLLQGRRAGDGRVVFTARLRA